MENQQESGLPTLAVTCKLQAIVPHVDFSPRCKLLYQSANTGVVKAYCTTFVREKQCFPCCRGLYRSANTGKAGLLIRQPPMAQIEEGGIF